MKTTILLENCELDYNSVVTDKSDVTESGGAIVVVEAVLYANQCQFLSNTVKAPGSKGGAIYGSYSAVTLLNSIIR